MVEQTFRQLLCDRCGTGWTGKPTEEPQGWTGVELATPVLAVCDTRQHLCGRCSMALSRFLNNKPVGRGSDG